MEEHRAIEFLTATADGPAVDGWHWLIEWSTTSFYIKSMNPAMQATKVSLHGPDPKHAGKNHFRFDVERKPEFVERAARFGGRLVTDRSHLPVHFSGRRMDANTTHIVRFSMAHDAFAEGAPPAGGSDVPKEKATMRGLLAPPAEGYVRHVDVFLRYSGEPYWADKAKTRQTHSGLGFITNSLGWKLSAIAFDRPITLELDPDGDHHRGSVLRSDCFRGLTVSVDDTGVLWLGEKLIPKPLDRRGLSE